MYYSMSSLLSLFPREDVTNVGPYNYIPTTYICVIFVSLFGISTLLHAAQMIYFRIWWAFPTMVLAGTLEILGWSARLWSSYSPALLLPYEIQVTATILAPTPLLAANFIILGRLINRLGGSYSRLSPKWYSIIFCGCDVVSLTVQGFGGGMASTAAVKHEDPTLGGNVMLGGIIFQMVTISIYVVLAIEFFIRFSTDKPLRAIQTTRITPGGWGVVDKRIKIMVGALFFNTTCLFIRAIYRTIELLDGWSGRIISTQVYFNVLDGATIVLAIYTLNIAHPGVLLGTPETKRNQDIEMDDCLAPNTEDYASPG